MATATSRLTPRLVAAARTRMEASMGSLSLRQALLYDRRAGLTDLDVGRWMQRGEELRARGAHEDDADLTAHDRLTLELVSLDSARANRALMYAGEATARILASREPRMATQQVALIKHVWSVFGEVGPASELAAGERVRGDLDIPQAVMDLLTEDEVRAVEADLTLRAEAAARIRATVDAARRRTTVEPDVVH